MSYKIILYYNYTQIENPSEFLEEQKALCKNLNLKGRIIIATEGINGTLEGLESDINKYIESLKNDTKFADTHIKTSIGNGDSFPKLSIKIKPELVNLGLGDQDVNPSVKTAKHISAEELHELFESKVEFYIIDMRNDYEHKVGYFKDSILPEKLRHFRDLPTILEDIGHLKDKKIVTVCTGGVRCEKASGFLLNNGFKDVSQLYGGIVTYMERYPNTHFKGDLYVFDKRVIMGFNTESPDYEIVGKCELCGSKCNNYINCKDDICHAHFICCANCLSDTGEALCSRKHQEVLNNVN